MQRTQCSLGTRENQRTDSDLFAPGSACRRIRHVMSDVERSEGKTVACLLSELEGERTELDNHLSGDEHEFRIMDFYDDDYNLFKEKLIARIPKTSTLLGNIPLAHDG